VQNGCITQEQYCEQFGINPKPEEGHYIVPIGQTIIPAGEEFDLSTIPLPEDEKPEEEPKPEEPKPEEETPEDEDKKKP
jgi:hypothetical protein